jgi:hypothetical protein
MRRVVQVQHTLALARFTRARQRAALARLVAGHAEVVRDLVAGAPDDRTLRAELAPVGRVGGQDPVLPVEQDVRLGQAFQVGHQFGQDGGHASGLAGAGRPITPRPRPARPCAGPALAGEHRLVGRSEWRAWAWKRPGFSPAFGSFLWVQQHISQIEYTGACCRRSLQGGWPCLPRWQSTATLTEATPGPLGTTMPEGSASP